MSTNIKIGNRTFNGVETLKVTNADDTTVQNTFTLGEAQTKIVTLSMTDGNQTVSPDSGKVLSGVTITKPATMIASNIKKDVNIGGIVGTYEGGGGTGLSIENNNLIIVIQQVQHMEGYPYLTLALMNGSTELGRRTLTSTGDPIFVALSGDSEIANWFGYSGTLSSAHKIKIISADMHDENNTCTAFSFGYYDFDTYIGTYNVGAEFNIIDSEPEQKRTICLTWKCGNY